MTYQSSVYDRPMETLVDKYRRVADCLAPNSKVLELGCSSGYFTQKLVSQGHEVIGLEGDPDAVAAAKEIGLDVRCCDLSHAIEQGVPVEHMDAVLAMDVLEHLSEPELQLRALFSRMRSGSQLLVTGPNVAHLSVRLALLRGRWDYQDTGILDRTHLRFYTVEGWRSLVSAAGFEIQQCRHAEIGPLPANRLFRALLGKRLTDKLAETLMRRWPNLFAIVILVQARKP